MFDFLKKKRGKSITVSIIFGAIILVFVFFGYQTETTPAGYAATINNKTITINEYRRLYDRQINFYTQIFGDKFNFSQQAPYIRQQTLDQLIRTELLAQAARQEGLWVSDAQVRDQIFNYPAFQKDGRFQRDYYKSVLQSNRLSDYQFENELRRDQMVQNLRTLFQEFVKPTGSELKREYEVGKTRVKVEFLLLDLKDMAAKMGPSEEEIQVFLNNEENRKRATDYYDSHLADYTQEEQIRARHILIKANPKEKKTQSEALKKIQNLREQIENGGDFGTIAETDYSGRASSLTTYYSCHAQKSAFTGSDSIALCPESITLRARAKITYCLKSCGFF